MIYATYYTDGWAAKAERLKESLARFHLQLHAERITADCPERLDRSYGTIDVAQNICAKKPAYLLRLLDFYCESVCWLDADLVVRERPEFLEGRYDVCFCRNHFPDGTSRAISAVFAVSSTPLARMMLKAWERALGKYPFLCDDRCLDRVIKRCGGLRLQEFDEAKFGSPKWRLDELKRPWVATAIGHMEGE